MKTYIFVRNKIYRPSTYYRLYQYIAKNNTNSNFKVVEFENNRYYKIKEKTIFLRIFNVVFNSLLPGYTKRLLILLQITLIKFFCDKYQYKIYVQRECFPKFIGPIGSILLNRVLSKANEIYWDFDDNIFESKEISTYEKMLLLKYTNKITVGNQYLVGKINELYKNKIVVLNTTDITMSNLNLKEINQNRSRTYESEINLIWVGTKGNLRFIEQVIPFIDEAAEIIDKKVVLKIVSDGIINKSTKKLVIKNIRWERSLAYKEMLASHIGLMPLEDNEFTRGKCAFKAVQAIGCGLPVILSNVGMNYTVVEKGNGILANSKIEWIEGLNILSNNLELWKEKSILSRQLWEEKFNPNEIKSIILEMVDN